MLTIDSTCTNEPTLIASPALKDDTILIGSKCLHVIDAYNAIDGLFSAYAEVPR